MLRRRICAAPLWLLRFFNPMSGLALLVASVLAGLLWDGLGASATFIAGAAFCGLILLGTRLAPVGSART